MSGNQYLIKNLNIEENWKGKGLSAATIFGTKLTDNNIAYYGLYCDSYNPETFLIGFIAEISVNVVTPILLTNNEDYAKIISNKDFYTSIGEHSELMYNQQKYYFTTRTTYNLPFNSESIVDNIIPVYTGKTFPDHETAALKLIELYKAEGGLMPGEEPEPSPSQEYSKVEYTRINWENKSTSLKTPLNESNLNKMDKTISDLCKNLDIAHTESDVKKLDKSLANKLISETPTWDAETGILTFKFFDGTQFSVDFNIEKIPVSFSMDSAGVITMETADGTRWTADISKVIPSDYTFSNGARITFTETTGEDGTKKITADIVKGSITDEYLATDFLAKITSNVNAASSSAASAASSATDAAADAKLAQSYAIGGSGMRDGENTDNAKYYAQKSAENLHYAKNLIEYGEDITD